MDPIQGRGEVRQERLSSDVLLKGEGENVPHMVWRGQPYGTASSHLCCRAPGGSQIHHCHN